MHFHPYEVTFPHVAYACLGGFAVLFGMFSLFLREKLYIGEACWAFLFGVIVGPYGANIFNPRGWGNGDAETTNALTLEFTRVVLAIGVFAVGVELPKAYMARHWKSLFFLLVPVMTWGWFVSAGLIYALTPGLNFLSSLAIAACLTPTDPVLAAAVVGGKYADKHVPAHIRHLLAAESGCNDGAAVPFLYIALHLIIDSPRKREAVQEWIVISWLYKLILGAVIGALIGFAFRYLMKFCQRRDLMDRHSFVAQYLSLALFTIGLTTLIGCDDLLAAFACGTAFAWDGFFNKQTEESVFSSVIDLLFNIAAFIFVGAWIPFDQFHNHKIGLTVWRLIVIALLILFLRRLPVIVALYKFIPDIKTFREAAFTGHFGPIGIGALFLSTLATEILHKSSPQEGSQTKLLMDTIQPIVAFMVVCSIVIHGLSIPSFSLGRRVHTASRTWSRHAPPDWTNQATLVDRGAANIIINRDPDVDVERGELGPDGILEKQNEFGLSERLDSKAPSVTVGSVSERPLVDKSRESDEGMDVAEEGRETMREQGRSTSPSVNVWQEGDHIVIERCMGPGQDVEVEVVRDPKSHGPTDVIHNHLDSALTKLHHAPYELEKELKRVARHIQADIHKTQGGNEGVDDKAGEEKSGAEEDNSDQEGWSSEQSVSSQPKSTGRVSTTSPTKDRKKRHGRLGKQTTAPPASGPSNSADNRRRRNSKRRGKTDSSSPTLADDGLTSVLNTDSGPRPRASKTPEENTETEMRPRRGRLPKASERLGHGGISRVLPGSRPSTAGSLRQSRLENLRMLGSSSSRDQSPTRSIRFADDGGGGGNRSGTSTPRLSIFQTESPASLAEGENVKEDKGETKVTFDL